MPKSLKKGAVTEKPKITNNIKKLPSKSSVKKEKPNNTEAKTITKIADKPEKSPQASKQSVVLALLQRSGGATVDELAMVTNWQKHSLQGMMSGVLRKKLGLTITSDKEERGRVYRITGGVSRL